MIGIVNIANYISEKKLFNLDKNKSMNIDKSFIDKIGIEITARKNKEEKASDLCVKAYNELLKKIDKENFNDIDLLVVCTQNGDYQIPHTSAIVHSKLGFSNNVATFDISLGCSGYIYSLDIVKGFMLNNNYKNALIFTADPYSDIIDDNDKNTELLFGDAATVTLLSCINPVFEITNSLYSTYGDKYFYLIKEKEKYLYMDGKGIFNFTLQNVPRNINDLLSICSYKEEDIDMFIFHQANKYMLESLIKRMKLDINKVPIAMNDYGNTVSSSIPIVLSNYINNYENNNILLCGFGVGLSISSCILRRII